MNNLFTAQGHRTIYRLALLTVLISAPLVLSRRSIAVERQPVPMTPAQPNDEPALNLPTSPAETTTAEDLVTLMLRTGRRLSVRGSVGLCPVSPGLVGELTLWHDRPLFLWQGSGATLTVRDRTTRTVLWQQALAPNQQSAIYGGEPLQAGQRYQWQILGATASDTDRELWNTFIVMPETDRQSITQTVTSLTHSSALPEAIALQKASYFAEQSLWSDALQVLYAIDQPSASVVKAQQDLVNYLCPSSRGDQVSRH